MSHRGWGTPRNNPGFFGNTSKFPRRFAATPRNGTPRNGSHRRGTPPPPGIPRIPGGNPPEEDTMNCSMCNIGENLRRSLTNIQIFSKWDRIITGKLFALVYQKRRVVRWNVSSLWMIVSGQPSAKRTVTECAGRQRPRRHATHGNIFNSVLDAHKMWEIHSESLSNRSEFTAIRNSVNEIPACHHLWHRWAHLRRDSQRHGFIGSSAVKIAAG